MLRVTLILATALVCAAAPPTTTPAASTPTQTTQTTQTTPTQTIQTAQTTQAAETAKKLKTLYSWKQLDWQFSKAEDHTRALQEDVLNPAKANPLAFDVWKDKVFITTPRWKATGVPSTLSYLKISENPEGSSPLLLPYPSAEVNTVPEKRLADGEELPHKIVGTIRVRVDDCDRLWVFDSGLVDVFDPKVYGPAKLLIYDLNNDSLIRQYPLKATDQGEHSFFANIVVDSIPGKCEEAFAYIPDISENAIVVYDYNKNESWKIKHNFFHFEPTFTLFDIGGEKFHWEDGVFGIALSKPNSDNFRTVYFHPLASSQEFKVSSHILQNRTLCEDPENFYNFTLLGSKGPNSQASSSFLDQSTGILYFTQLNKNGIACWNSVKNADDFRPETIALIAQDDKELIFPNEVKVDKNGDLWAISNRVPQFSFGKIDPTDVNYRIFKTNAKDLYKGTVCDPDYKG